MNDAQKKSFKQLLDVSHASHQKFLQILNEKRGENYEDTSNLTAAALSHKLEIHRAIAKVKRNLVIYGSQQRSISFKSGDTKCSASAEIVANVASQQLVGVEVLCGFSCDEFVSIGICPHTRDGDLAFGPTVEYQKRSPESRKFIKRF